MKMFLLALGVYLGVVLLPPLFICSMSAFYHIDLSIYNPVLWSEDARLGFNMWWGVVTFAFIVAWLSNL